MTAISQTKENVLVVIPFNITTFPVNTRDIIDEILTTPIDLNLPHKFHFPLLVMDVILTRKVHDELNHYYQGKLLKSKKFYTEYILKYFTGDRYLHFYNHPGVFKTEDGLAATGYVGGNNYLNGRTFHPEKTLHLLDNKAETEDTCIDKSFVVFALVDYIIKKHCNLAPNEIDKIIDFIKYVSTAWVEISKIYPDDPKFTINKTQRPDQDLYNMDMVDRLIKELDGRLILTVKTREEK